MTRKLLAFSFWEFRRILLAVSGDWLLDFRAMALLAFTEICVVLIALELGSMALGHRLIPGSEQAVTAFGWILALAITAINHYAVSHKDHWKRYEREFDGYSKTIKSIGWLVMITMLVAAGTTAVWLTAVVRVLPR
jgi:hypothetical protein